jgi:hypothetical protein
MMEMISYLEILAMIFYKGFGLRPYLGGGRNDVLVADDGDNFLFGGVGNDKFFGGPGNEGGSNADHSIVVIVLIPY